MIYRTLSISSLLGLRRSILLLVLFVVVGLTSVYAERLRLDTDSAPLFPGLENLEQQPGPEQEEEPEFGDDTPEAGPQQAGTGKPTFKIKRIINLSGNNPINPIQPVLNFDGRLVRSLDELLNLVNGNIDDGVDNVCDDGNNNGDDNGDNGNNNDGDDQGGNDGGNGGNGGNNGNDGGFGDGGSGGNIEFVANIQACLLGSSVRGFTRFADVLTSINPGAGAFIDPIEGGCTYDTGAFNSNFTNLAFLFELLPTDQIQVSVPAAVNSVWSLDNPATVAPGTHNFTVRSTVNSVVINFTVDFSLFVAGIPPRTNFTATILSVTATGAPQ